MDNLFVIRSGFSVIIQRAQYIEDGMFIKVEGESITLFEIPSFGGEPTILEIYSNLPDAIDGYRFYEKNNF